MRAWDHAQKYNRLEFLFYSILAGYLLSKSTKRCNCLVVAALISRSSCERELSSWIRVTIDRPDGLITCLDKSSSSMISINGADQRVDKSRETKSILLIEHSDRLLSDDDENDSVKSVISSSYSISIRRRGKKKLLDSSRKKNVSKNLFFQQYSLKMNFHVGPFLQ
jgi:hypothetical protein